eukprot:15443407-Alexandrium_andersonii.AAC.1
MAPRIPQQAHSAAVFALTPNPATNLGSEPPEIHKTSFLVGGGGRGISQGPSRQGRLKGSHTR